MRAPNHIAGGVVFTGIFCSFWNVNIFASSPLVGLTVFASLLPDIDHSRSVIGKMFLPVARWLDRHYGHRTITHSLVFFIISCLVVKIIEVGFQLEHLFLVYSFALGSHLIFDMLTRQGVPLFYPFYRNPCVIGSNPDLRLSGSGTGEVVVFSVFLVMLYFCFPLFQNGFWVSYNKNFNSLSHLHSSANQVETLMRVDYDFSNDYGRQQGSGLLVYHTASEAILKTEAGLVTVSSADQVLKLQPEITSLRKRVETISFSGISLDSLLTYSDQLVMSGSIVSEEPFLFQGEETKKAELEWVQGFTMGTLARDSSELQIKRLEYEHQQSLYNLQLEHWRILQQMERELLATLESGSATDYELEMATNKLKQVRKELEGYLLDDSALRKVKKEYQQAVDNSNIAQQFSGSASVLVIDD